MEYTEIFSDLLKKTNILAERFKSGEQKELSESDKLAICYAAGVSLDFSVEGTTLTMRTKVPCSVVWDGKKFLVCLQSGSKRSEATQSEGEGNG